MFIYFWERQGVSGGGSEREGDAESQAGSRLWAVSTKPNTGLELTDREIMTWAKVGGSTDWATQVPQYIHKVWMLNLYFHFRKSIFFGIPFCFFFDPLFAKECIV